MSNTIVENKWNPVSITNKKRAGTPQSSTYNISSYAISSSWYNKIVSNDGTRYNRMKNYHEVDMCSVEISRALDIIAEDVSSVNADSDEHIFLSFDEDAITKTLMKLLKNAIEIWTKRTEFDMELFDRVRRTLKFGATFYKKNDDGSLTELPPERMVGYVLSEDDENFVTHYLYNPNLERVDNRGKRFSQQGGNINTLAGRNTLETYSVDDLLVLKIGNHPFGESIIERVYGVWRTMKLIEDAIVVYRVTRSYERRVYYIDVGNLQGPKREAAIERQRLRLMQKKTAKGGELYTNYDPHTMGEDIFIPTNSTGKGSRVETLQGGSQLGELTDLEWFYKKLAAGLRIPSSLIDPNDQSQNQHSDARVGQLYAAEYRYLSHVKRIKVRIAKELHKNFVDFSANREISVPDSVCLTIANSMSFAEYKDMERNQGFLNVANSTLQLNQISKRMVLSKYLGMEEDEIQYNEEQKLRERGITDEQIKTMDRSEIDQIVYGVPKPSVLEKYGIVVEEGGRW
jgi:hypothetical protein